MTPPSAAESRGDDSAPDPRDSLRPDRPNRRRRRFRLRSTLGVFAVAGILLGLGYLAAAAYNGEVTVGLCSGLVGPAHFVYVGNSSGFLTDFYGVRPLYCEAIHTAPGAVLSAGLDLHSYDPLEGHVIQVIVVEGPFASAAVDPTPPQPIAPGGNLSFEVSFHVPSVPGTYSAPAVVVTAV